MGILNYNQDSINDQKSIFLPMFCRLSIKDVKINTAPPISAADPSSPRVSCMGQVKRNNRVTGFPATAATIIAAHHHHKHTKPRKVHFSTKTLLPNPPAAAAAPSAGRKSGSRSCRSNREMCVRDSRRSSSVANNSYDRDNNYQDCVKVVVDISKMDPPLPVVKRVAPPQGNCRDEVNLWKRRSNGMKSMQIEPINLPGNKFPPPLPPPTTV
ncbi:hypothetical protein C2S51_014996 [Perilla frutescens var. frutescens]|nr:hypothetical protein C2S51_014996 [Perilla frutescens var. frutescens]